MVLPCRQTVDVINKHCKPLYFLNAVTQLFDSGLQILWTEPATKIIRLLYIYI